MFRLGSVIILLITKPLLAEKPPPCIDSLAKIANKNGFISAQKYESPHSRPLHIYQELLGEEFTAITDSQPNLTWLDVGGGYGIASLTRSAGGSKTIVINSQDFWSLLLDPKAVDNPRLDKKFLGGMALGLGIHIEDAIGPEGEPLPGWKPKLLSRITKVYKGALATGKFDYRVGFAESIVPNLEKKFDLISDSFGAYYYSGGRIKLIDQYYDALKPGGTAFVLFRSLDRRLISKDGDLTWVQDPAHGPSNRVKLNDGKSENLEEYLAHQYPSIFKIDEAGGYAIKTKVLVIRRDARVTSLDLEDKFVEKSSFGGSEGVWKNQVPNSEWQLKKKTIR